ncbi:MAG: ABC transporter substrate-binding protein [Halobacteriovoraceae bacterium]|nr:ABC transporter substrate-binding protein [Halobacteriovoraceae bacterium]
MRPILFLVFLFSVKEIFSIEKVDLYLKWKHSFQFAGYYAALEKGFFKSEGLDVTFHEKNMEWTTVEKTLEGTGKYGISDSSIVLDYLKDRPVIILSSIFQHSPLVLATRYEDKIFGPLELKGKRIMYQKDVDDAVLHAMFDSVGLHDNDFYHVSHSYKNEDLINKTVDAISIYTTAQPFYFNKINFPIYMISPSNYGIDLYGDTLFTTTREIEQHPQRAEAFRRASIKGWYYALSNPEEICKLIKEKYDQNLDIEQLLFEAKETAKVIRQDITPIGYTHPGRLEKISNIYVHKYKLKHKNVQNILFDQYLINKNASFLNRFKIIGILAFILLILFLLVMLFNKKLQEEVAAKTTEIVELQKSKDLFFANLTHELRTPLNAIIGGVSFLKDTYLDEIQKDHLELIDFSSNILLDIVNDILDFSKLQKNKIELSINRIELRNLIQNIYLNQKILADNKNLKFELISDLNEEFWVNIDYTRLTQVLNNLISNAIKFTTIGKVIINFKHEFSEEGDRLYFEIKDSGKGIDESKIKTLFKPYVQEDNSIINNYGGTGLGLAISKQIIELMNGQMEVKNNEEGGACFSFSIPVSISSSQNNLQDDVNIELSLDDLKMLKVLVVEDNPINCKVIRQYLENLSISPKIVNNGLEAIENLEKNEFDIILMDKFMPVLDGPATTKKIRTHQDKKIAHTYIIGLSANWKNGFDEECKDLQMNASLTKPLTKEELKKALQRYFTYTKEKSAA